MKTALAHRCSIFVNVVCTPLPQAPSASRHLVELKVPPDTGERLAPQGTAPEDRRALAPKWQLQPHTSLRGGPAQVSREL